VIHYYLVASVWAKEEHAVSDTVILGSSQLLHFKQLNTLTVGIVYLACSGTSMSLILWIALVMITWLGCTVPRRTGSRM
jgi:ABC-type siderophore export system fused ATPase/permease subunit